MSHTMELTEQMAAGDALLRQRGLHCGNGGGEDVGLLEHLRGVRAIQRAEHSAVIELHALVEFDHRELISAGLGAPVFVLQSQTQTQMHASNEVKSTRPAIPLHILCRITAVSPTAMMLLLQYSPPPSSPSGRRVPVPWPFSELPHG